MICGKDGLIEQMDNLVEPLSHEWKLKWADMKDNWKRNFYTFDPGTLITSAVLKLKINVATCLASRFYGTTMNLAASIFG